MSAPIKIFGNLIAEVINKGLCMYCGTCIASCPVNVIAHSEEEKPVMKGICALCQVCYYSCPRIELSLDESENSVFGTTRSPDDILGVVKEVYAARATDNEILKVCQDGGVTTALEIYALESGFVDLAVLTEPYPEEEWVQKPSVASNRSDALRAAGSRYSPNGTVSGLGDIETGYPKSEVMFVGLPCQIQGLQRLVTSSQGNKRIAQQVKVSIGLFCMDSFHHKNLMEIIKDAKIDSKNITKTDIKKNMFQVFEGKELVLEVPVKQLGKSRIEGCASCQDFTAELADISIGALGSPEGWCTVLLRSQTGEKLFKGALEKKMIEAKKIKVKDLTLPIKLSTIKRKRDAPYLKAVSV